MKQRNEARPKAPPGAPKSLSFALLAGQSHQSQAGDCQLFCSCAPACKSHPASSSEAAVAPPGGLRVFRSLAVRSQSASTANPPYTTATPRPVHPSPSLLRSTIPKNSKFSLLAAHFYLCFAPPAIRLNRLTFVHGLSAIHAILRPVIQVLLAQWATCHSTNSLRSKP